MKMFLFICTRHRKFGIFNFYALSATPYCFARYIILEKDDFFMKYFKLVHVPTWKIPYCMTGFLSICTRQESFGIFNNFPLSATLLCLVRYNFVERWIFNVIVQVGACPNLKDSLISEYFSLHTYKTYRVRYHHFLRYLRLPNALQGTLFWKKMIFSWNISSWCMPQLERFLIIWQVFYSYAQGKKQFVSSTFFLYLRLSDALYGPSFWKKMIFNEIYQVGACPNFKDSYYMTYFLSICTRQESFGIFNNFPLPATLLCLVQYIFFE